MGLDVGVVVSVQAGGVAGPPVGVGAGVGGVVQDLDDPVVGERLEEQLTAAGSAMVAGGEGQLLFAECPDDAERRSGGGEGVEEQPHCVARARVGVQHHLAGLVVDKSDREGERELAAAGLGQDPAAHPGPQEMQLEFRHLAFHPQKDAVVEDGRVIQAVLVADKRVGMGADLDELLPVGGVAGQPGAFQAQDDAGPAQGDLGDQVLEPGPVGGRGAGAALVDVDDVDFVLGPAERGRAALQVVLARCRLGVVDHLVEGGLADVEVGVAAQPRGSHLGDVIAAHGRAFLLKGGGLTAGMAERHLREHRDDLRGERQRRAGRRAGITSVRAGTGRDRVGGGQGRAGLRRHCCLVVASAGTGGPLGQPGCHSPGGQHRQLIPPAAARAGQRDRAQGLIAPDRRVCA